MRKTVMRVMTVMIAVAAVTGFASLAVAGGGSAPPVAGLAPSGRSTITGTVVMDPHMVYPDPVGPATQAAKYAVVTLQAKSKKTPSSSVAIKINDGFLLLQGCNLGLTETRFVHTGTNNARMRDWILDADLVALFAGLGEVISEGEPVHDPVITAVTAQQCIDIGSGVDVPSDGSLPGWLVMEFVVDFLGPATGKK